MIPAPEAPGSSTRRRWGLALTVASLLLVAWLTLRPGQGGAGGVADWTPSDVALNILLFMPFGVGLALSGLPPLHVLLIGTLVSGGIEGAQRWVVSGRYASVIDLASNGLGALAGALAVVKWGARSRWWPWVARLLSLLVVLAWLIGGYLVQPAIPGAGGWRSEWAPPAPDGARFRGEILDVRLQHRPLPPGPVTDAGGLRSQLMASRKTTFSTRFVWPAPSGDSVAIAQVTVGPAGSRFLALVQQGPTLLAYQRTGLRWVGLPTPWIGLPGTFHAAAGDTVEVRLVATHHAIELAATAGRQTAVARLRLSPDLYFAAQWNRATDGLLWWWVVPGACTLYALGLALARRPLLLGVLIGVLLLGSATGGGAALSPPVVWIVGGIAAWGGRRSALAWGLFPVSPPGIAPRR